MTVSPGRRDRGAVIPLIALALPVLILMTSFAVDLGRQRALRRDLQADADVIALDLTRILPVPAASTPPSSAETLTALNASLTRNGLPTVTSYADESVSGVKVEWGTGTPPPGTDQFPRTIVTAPPSCFTAGTAPYDAVRVTLHDEIDYFFQPGPGGATRSAIAALGDEPTAEFVLGSTLVNITPPSSWIIGRILQTIIPGADLIGYGGLANARVTLGDLATALGIGTADELLTTTVSYEQLVVAAADALQASGGDAAAIAVLDQLVALGIQDVQVGLGEVLGLGNVGTDAGFDGWVSIPHLLLAGVGIADGTHTITIPDTVLNVAGLASVTLELTAIDPPIRVGTAQGASGSTDQVALGVTIELDVSGDKSQRLCELPSGERTILGALLGGVFQLLNCLLAPLTQAALDVQLDGSIDLDMILSEVNASQQIDCAAPGITVDYDSDPIEITATPAVSANVTFDGAPLTLLGVSAPASAISAAGPSGTTTFTATDAGPRHVAFNPTTTRVGSPNLGLANLLAVNGLQVTVVNANLPVLGGIARNLVAPLVNNILTEVDQLVITEVSRLLGLNLGGADITPQWMECEENTVSLVG
ncbi:MAG: hypothetical protein ACO1PW_05115 [Actinomycetota bacterium]